MTEKIQISKRLDDGTIIVVGGDSVAEFALNVKGMLGEGGADEIRALFYHLIPASAPEAALVTSGHDPFTAARAAFPQAEPVPVAAPPQDASPLCPNHNLPAKLVPAGVSKTTGKPYSSFYSCPMSDRACRLSTR